MGPPQAEQMFAVSMFGAAQRGQKAMVRSLLPARSGCRGSAADDDLRDDAEDHRDGGDDDAGEREPLALELAVRLLALVVGDDREDQPDQAAEEGADEARDRQAVGARRHRAAA